MQQQAAGLWQPHLPRHPKLTPTPNAPDGLAGAVRAHGRGAHEHVPGGGHAPQPCPGTLPGSHQHCRAAPQVDLPAGSSTNSKDLWRLPGSWQLPRMFPAKAASMAAMEGINCLLCGALHTLQPHHHASCTVVPRTAAACIPSCCRAPCLCVKACPGAPQAATGLCSKTPAQRNPTNILQQFLT